MRIAIRVFRWSAPGGALCPSACGRTYNYIHTYTVQYRMLHECQPTLKYLAIGGLVPYTRGRRQQQWQQLFTLLVQLANWMATVSGIICFPLGEELFVSNLVSVGVFLTQTVALTVCHLETAFTYAQHFSFFRRLQAIAGLFRSRLHTRLCHCSLQRQQRRRYVCYLVACYGSLCISMVVISTKYYYGYLWFALLSIVVLRLRSFQALMYMDYIGFYMALLNMKLKSLVSCRVAKERRCLDVDYNMLESFDYLLSIKQLYNELFKLTTCFNDLFGHSLCALFTVFFLDITVNSYWTFLALANIYERYFLYLTLATVVPLITILSFLCYTGERCKQEYRLTATLVQRLLNSSYKDTNTKAYNDLLMEFLVQIVQDPIVVSAKGFITVDLKLLMQIFVSIVTYLVILMQFRSSDQELKTSSA